MASNQKTKEMSERTARRILKKFFLRNGYVRIKDESKLEKKGSQKYKKGYEVRFSTRNEEELELIQTAISTLGYNVSKTFKKNNRVVQPLYGKAITLKFHKMKLKNARLKQPK